MEELVLLVTSPENGERTGFAFRGRIVAGRDEDCDLRLPDRKVSRRHAEFSLRTDGSILIRDLNSANGTIVDGRKIRGGEVIVFGEAAVKVGPYAILASGASQVDEGTILSDDRTQLG